MNTIAAEAKTAGPTQTKLPRDFSIDYLRTAITLMVVVAHVCLAYARMSHVVVPTRGYNLLVPILDDDQHVSLFCDYFFNWADLFFIALMFFISALFAYPSLNRHGVKRFLRDRLLRIALPFFFTVIFVLPIGLFASFKLDNPDASYLHFWLLLAKGHFFVGPPWFLWVLMVFDFALAMLYTLFHPAIQKLGPWLRSLKYKPVSSAGLLVLPCALSYTLLQHRYGYDFDTWHSLLTPPFSLQPARIGIYIVWCTAGFLVGSVGLEDGLLARSGSLLRHWKTWLAIGLISFHALWFMPFLSAFQQASPRAQHLLHAIVWACGVSTMCFGALAFFRSKLSTHRRWMDSLTRSAYCIYLIHFVFVLWGQRLLLPYHFSVNLKVLIGVTASIFLSWLTGTVLTRIPGIRQIV